MYCTSTFICHHSISYLKLFASSITIVVPPPFFAATIVCCLRRSLLTSFASLVVRCHRRSLPIFTAFAATVVRCHFFADRLLPLFAVVWCHLLPSFAFVVRFRHSLLSFAAVHSHFVVRCHIPIRRHRSLQFFAVII